MAPSPGSGRAAAATAGADAAGAEGGAAVVALRPKDTVVGRAAGVAALRAVAGGVARVDTGTELGGVARAGVGSAAGAGARTVAGSPSGVRAGAGTR